jgi:hypothetical protein
MENQKDSRLFGLLIILERFMLLAAFCATAVTALLMARNGLESTQQPASFGLVFWLWFATLYGFVALTCFVVSLICNRVFRSTWPFRIILGLGAFYVLGALALANRRPLVQLFEVEGSFRLRYLCPLAFLMSVIGLAAVALLPRYRASITRLFCGLALAIFVLAFWPTRPLSASSPPHGRRSIIRLSGERLLLFGLDGADWAYVDTLMARGELPNLRALRDQGVWAPLTTIRPTMSPVVWTTIATGHTPTTHGIRRFTNRRIRGVGDPLPRLRPIHRLGYSSLMRWLKRSGRVFESPVSGISCRVPTFWNLAMRYGLPVTVVNWWATWPAEPNLGDIVTERFNYWRFAVRGWPPENALLTYPPALQTEIASLIMSPDDVTYEHARIFMDVTAEEFAAFKAESFKKHTISSEFQYFYSMFETNRRIALHLVERGRRRWGTPPDMMIIVRLVDSTCHAALKYSDLVTDHLDASQADRRKFGRVVTESYHAADMFLGELMDAFGCGNVVVVSDHGFQRESYWPNWHKAYGHNHAPDGIFIASGPAFGRGRVDGMSVYEVFPIMAYLKAFPLANDLPGRLPLEVFDKRLRSRQPVRRIASYGEWQSRRSAWESSTVDDQMIEHLKALGYIQ